MVWSFSRWALTAVSRLTFEAYWPPARIIAAMIPIMAMTIRISMSVKAALELFAVSFMLTALGAGADLLVAHFLFHSFAEPLFDHALIIQNPGPGQPLNPCQHS